MNLPFAKSSRFIHERFIMLTQEILKKFLTYESETGIFRWNEDRGRVKKDEVAGSLTNWGYVQIRILGKMYSGHKLAWLYVYGEFPKLFIDHINRIRNDNRIGNLRLATKSQNSQNTTICKLNTSGHKGVSWCKREGKWRAFIKLNGKYKSLGYHENKTDAITRYVNESKKLHTHNLF